MEKVIVITGASEGLGKSIAEKLLENEENKVIILSHNEDKLKNTANELNCEYELCDVTDYSNVQNTIQKILEKYNKIDVLINNAGIWLSGDITECEYERISKCIAVNKKRPIWSFFAYFAHFNC